jgi:F0F1-type ATP synthase membrane subunit b/b'
MVETLFTAAMGPFGALAVLLLVLLGVYKFVTTQAFPLAIKYVDNQQDNIKEILKEHRKDREVFETTISSLAKRQERVEEDIDAIKIDIRFIKERT